MNPRTTWHPRADMDVARRSDGWAVVRGSTCFWLLPAGAGVPSAMKATTMAAAIQEADEAAPPDGWRWSGSAWVCDVWHVVPGDGGWVVCTPDGARPVRSVPTPALSVVVLDFFFFWRRVPTPACSCRIQQVCMQICTEHLLQYQDRCLHPPRWLRNGAVVLDPRFARCVPTPASIRSCGA
jgi:hypothetical protein